MSDATGSETASPAPAPAGANTSDANATPDDSAESGPGPDLKNSYKEALARKTGRNSHAEQHLIGRQVGGGNNDTHKRTFRRKSG